MAIKTISDSKAIFTILHEKERFICFLGAGASAEARVMTARRICDEVRANLIRFELENAKDVDEATRNVEKRLKWSDVSNRYVTCMREGFPTKLRRVSYFRKLLQNVQPAFCHHAVALLMAGGYLRPTCLTTNFDKLIESAFTQQGRFECQPLRSEDELKYWSLDKGRQYILKLHGDYDTENVLNTDEETITIRPEMQSKVKDLCDRAGMIVIGSAGNENSIQTMFENLTDDKAAPTALQSGLLWGVYMGQPKPSKPLSSRDLEDMIQERIDAGEVGDRIVNMMRRSSKREEPFCFFPVWGAGNFLSSLIAATPDRELIGTAELHLDREMRLRKVFGRVPLDETAIEKHITALQAQEAKIPSNAEGAPKRSLPSRPILKAYTADHRVEINGIYGDITSRTMMSEPKGVRRAVVSPEDTCLSAGGGVALGLITKGGFYQILNEMQKFSPIAHGTVAVTSGGNLPVHYIFHAASIEIQKNGNYGVSEANIFGTMGEVLRHAAELDVRAVWVPLMGTGVGPLSAEQSLSAIIKAIVAKNDPAKPISVTVVIYDEQHLLPNKALRCVQEAVDATFTVEALYPSLAAPT